jgi:quinol monooxygenase YgiN
MKELAAEVEKNEPGCQLYQVFTNPADGTIIVVERYTMNNPNSMSTCMG